MEENFVIEITGPAASGKSMFKNTIMDESMIDGDEYLENYFKNNSRLGRKLTYLIIMMINFKYYRIIILQKNRTIHNYLKVRKDPML